MDRSLVDDWRNRDINEMNRKKIVVTLVILAIAAAGGYIVIRKLYQSPRSQAVIEFINHPAQHSDWVTPALDRCESAPFQLPSAGFIGYFWHDSFYAGHTHQGVDIFGGTEPGVTPVYAAVDGYLTRLSDWKSSVIIRIPSDPLQPDRQIWLYYTHMADESGKSFIDDHFPAGTDDVFVKAGTLLGYQGNYSGDPGNPTGIHLHISIVQDDGNGKWKDERDANNTYDPSPYFGRQLDGRSIPGGERSTCLVEP